MENWQKRKIDRSLKYQTRVFSEHINELVAVKRDGKVITLDDGRKMVEFVSCYHGAQYSSLYSGVMKSAADCGAFLCFRTVTPGVR
ncbi:MULTISPECIES: hypothetical protein [Klebsiella]|uniref:Uncharacterized protein n=1 Tax=Klebsiella michiganensis TaxID=1134687 RepID=A0AB35PQX2_9ENTR|nr:hypothetical protein [Klebsiella michiganensis]MBW5971089.1 hypothetical protein [Klebsiella michiganensis]MCW9454808.1 hypothetical protein [Klebsiella michiganensis]MCW9510122.1 hypothetical protein [Klebsiella michiganensis]MCW9611738.1 hypothetical protein [Klebsiella michiganensis]MDH1760609.1 hypothetical protein [Klebsiella michiganensis]